MKKHTTITLALAILLLAPAILQAENAIKPTNTQNNITQQYNIKPLAPNNKEIINAVCTLWDRQERWLGGAPTPTNLKSDLNDGYRKIDVMHSIRGDFIGFVQYNKPYRKHGYIRYLAIDKNFQGQGYGHTLLQHTIDKLESQGANEVALNVYADNEKAIRLYLRHDFALDGSTSLLRPYIVKILMFLGVIKKKRYCLIMNRTL